MKNCRLVWGSLRLAQMMSYCFHFSWYTLLNFITIIAKLVVKQNNTALEMLWFYHQLKVCHCQLPWFTININCFKDYPECPNDITLSDTCSVIPSSLVHSLTRFTLEFYLWFCFWLPTCPRQVLEQQKLGSGWLHRRDLYIIKQFNFPHASTHPGVTTSSPTAKWGLLSSSESCTVLQNRQTRSLDAKAWQHSSLTLCERRTASKEQCRRGYNWYVQNLLSKLIRMITAMYVAQWQYELWVNARILHGKWVTRRTSKNYRTVKNNTTVEGCRFYSTHNCLPSQMNAKQHTGMKSAQTTTPIDTVRISNTRPVMLSAFSAVESPEISNKICLYV